MSKKVTVLASVAAMLVISACHKGVGGQVLAVVNGEEITQQDLNRELQGATIPQGADKKQVMAQLLQRVVDRKLLIQDAKAQGLDKSPEYLDQMRRSQDALILNLLAAKAAKNIALPDSAAVTRYIAANPTMFSGRRRYGLDQIVFAEPSDPKLLKELEPAHSLDAVAAVLSAHAIQFARGKGELDTGSVPPAVASRIASLAPGEPFLVPDNGRIVASVIASTQAVPTPDDQAKPAAVKLLRQQSLSDTMHHQLDKDRASAKIEYKPGFAPPKSPPGSTQPPPAS